MSPKFVLLIGRSPSYSHLSATIEGLSVIRAFRKQSHFLTNAYSYMDKHTAAWHLYLAAQRCLGIEIDFFASLLGLVYIIVTVLVATQGKIDLSSLYST